MLRSHLLFLIPAAYQILAIAASASQILRRSKRAPTKDSLEDDLPGVSVLKPLRGLDPNTEEAFFSQINQDYPLFEVLFGVREESDRAVEAVRRLQAQTPAAPVRLIIGARDTPNGKVGILRTLSEHARYPVWVVNDSDIRVDPHYLADVVRPLKDPAIGLVTCPYRAMAHTLAAAWESLGISTDFMPSTFVAQLLGVREFGLGSTLAFRSEDLKAVGGFAAIEDYLADDYQLAKRVTSLGKTALLSTYVVETSLGDASWSGVWRHQVRWARTIRTSKGLGHLGLPITHAGLWIAVAICLGAWKLAGILYILRVLSALIAGAMVLRHRLVARAFWLAPLWDVYAFAVWLTSYAGKTVRWRDKELKIDRNGRIQSEIQS